MTTQHLSDSLPVSLGPTPRFSARLATSIKAGAFRLVKQTPERWLLRARSGAYYLVHFFVGVKLVTPTIVERRVGRRMKYHGRAIRGHVVLANVLSPTLLRGGGKILPLRTAVVGNWGSARQKLLSRLSNEEMKEILRFAGVPIPQRPFKASSIAPPTPVSPISGASAPEIMRSLKPQMQIDGYQIVRRLGKGFSAEVWLASVSRRIPGVALTVGQRVAIKFYKLPLLQGTESLRIQREFAIASDLSHANLARVFDLLISPSRPFHTFMVMEHVEGATLKDFIARNGALPPPVVVAIGRQLFEALEELHSSDAIHRDVKPANIILERESPVSLKLLDLGIVLVNNDSALTAHSAFLGSKHSAPLEQLTGSLVDHRADIYGAGATLFHCYTGKPMYDGVGPEGAIVQRMLQAPASVAYRQNASLGERSLVDFINRCIAVNKEKRPDSATACRRELENLAISRSLS